MEARVIRLEESVKSIQADMQVVKIDLQSVKERIGHLPTAPQIMWGGLVFLVGLAAVVLGTGSYMSGTMSTALSAIQTVIAAKPALPSPAPAPTIIVLPAQIAPAPPPSKP